MYLKSLKVTGFRNYRHGSVDFKPGTTIIVGNNGAGKSNLLEAAHYTLCGASFKTSRENEMITVGAGFFRTVAEVENGSLYVRSVSMEQGAGARVDSGGGPKWLEPGLVLCFSPDDLQLVKGPPRGRRRFLDDAISRRSADYRRHVIDYQKTIAQRNSFLQRARAGLVQLVDIVPWDRQLASLALRIFTSRQRHCQELSPEFESSVNDITGGGAEARVVLVSQVEGAARAADPEAVLVDMLRERWPLDLERLSTGTGTHRDDVEFVMDGKDVRPFGSQGEQRAAVLALLLAERKLSLRDGARRPLLLLDDVMSELDPDRRRRLMGALGQSEASSEAAAGQVVITAADKGLFSKEELEMASVIHVSGGRIEPPGAENDV